MTTDTLVRPIATSAELVAAVRLEAKENPDFNYRETFNAGDQYGSCYYVDEKTLEGMCLIGKAALRVGLDPTVFLETWAERTRNSASFIRIAAVLIEEMDPNEINWLSRVQMEQDAGVTWSEAVAKADAKFSKI